MYVFEGKNSNW